VTDSAANTRFFPSAAGATTLVQALPVPELNAAPVITAGAQVGSTPTVTAATWKAIPSTPPGMAREIETRLTVDNTLTTAPLPAGAAGGQLRAEARARHTLSGKASQWSDWFPSAAVQVATAPTAPTIEGSAVLAGRALTVSITNLTGNPPPTVTPSLTVDGDLDALELMTPGVYRRVFASSDAAIAYSGKLTASNGVGTPAEFNFSGTVAADLEPPPPGPFGFTDPGDNTRILTVGLVDPVSLTVGDGAYPARNGTDVFAPEDALDAPVFLFAGLIGVDDVVGETPAVGDTVRLIDPPLTVSNAALPAPALTYRWLANNAPIVGEIDPEELIVPAIPGQTLELEITATNADGPRVIRTNALVVAGDPAAINSVTYDAAGIVINYTGTLTVTYDAAGILLEVN
jgi:hypothetical protein